MEKIFYADKSAFPSSTAAVESILTVHFGISAPKINRTQNGNPYLESPSTKLFFSVSHTKTSLFIAFSDENVGIDAENLDRKVNYLSVLRKFPLAEQEEIHCAEDFLHLWTVKESAVKWLGGTLAHDLNKISYVNDVLRYKQSQLPVCVTTVVFQNHAISVCGERDFSQAEFISL